MFVKCKSCDGKGTRSFCGRKGMEHEPCSVCDGKRSFDIPEGKKLCTNCGGSKKAYYPIDRGALVLCTCETCNGKGFVEG